MIVLRLPSHIPVRATERERLAEIHAMPFGPDRARANHAYIRDYCREKQGSKP